MNCNKCQQENRPGSKFCRDCGNKLQVGKNDHVAPATIDISWVFSKLTNVNRKLLVTAVVIILLSGGVAYAAPKTIDQIEVNKTIKEALVKEENGNYNGTLLLLASVEGKWALEQTKNEITDINERNEKYLEYQEIFYSAIAKEEEGELEEARQLLQSIDSDFPEYEDVKEKLNEIQLAIEGGLRDEADASAAQARRAAAAEAEAKRQAEASATAKVAADAQRASAEARARAEAETAARAEAQAAASAQAARDAEIRRQQEEAEKIEQTRISFLNQLVTLWDSYGSGVDYYNDAMDQYNNGDYFVAIAVFGQARAVFQNTYNASLSLNNNFTGMSNEYVTAANNMKTAADYMIEATDLMIDAIGSYGSTSNVSYYSNLAFNYVTKVSSFLRSKGY